jgi:hypothetical protein
MFITKENVVSLNDNQLDGTMNRVMKLKNDLASNNKKNTVFYATIMDAWLILSKEMNNRAKKTPLYLIM